MQLAILMVILLMAGQNNFSQIKPIIEQFGGEDAKSAIKQAEELNDIITTVKTLTSPQDNGEQPPSRTRPTTAGQAVKFFHPLEPIKNIADERTLSALSTVIALGE